MYWLYQASTTNGTLLDEKMCGESILARLSKTAMIDLTVNVHTPEQSPSAAAHAHWMLAWEGVVLAIYTIRAMP